MVAERDLEAVVTRLRQRVTVGTEETLPVDAARALRAGRARPDGVARLLAAVLARHGAATRYVVGVLPRGDTLYTHAWVELAWPDSNWDTVDPLTGRRASTGLIRLARGGSSHPLDLMPLVSDVRFTPANEPASEGAVP
jgi:transglutaminase-like putative cysteine protease